MLLYLLISCRAVVYKEIHISIMKNDQENVRLREKLNKLEKTNVSLIRESEMIRNELDEKKSSLEKYKLMADFAHDWEMWFRPDFSFEYISPSCQHITGYAAGELINEPKLLNEIVFPEDSDVFRKYISDSMSFTNIRQSLNFRILTRTKQIRWCEIKCKAVYDNRGKYLGQRASVSDITRLMQALGEIKNLSEVKEFDARIRDRYLREIEDKDRELVGQLIAISQKNETLQYIKKTLTLYKDGSNKDGKQDFAKIIDHINNTLFASENWDSFKLHFEKIHPGFFERLQEAYPLLSSKDLRLCSYLRLNLTTKEIAGLMNITPQSAEISRVRLRKKLGLSRAIRLVEFISKI